QRLDQPGDEVIPQRGRNDADARRSMSRSRFGRSGHGIGPVGDRGRDRGGSLWGLVPGHLRHHRRAVPAHDGRVAPGPRTGVRTRMAAQTAAALEWPLAGALTGSLRVSGALSGSIFNADEPPPEVERRATRRFGVAIGVRYRL